MAENQYQWTDNPTVSGVSPCNTDILNDCLMHLKYESGGLGMPIGTIYPLTCTLSYVPEGSLPTDGAEYTKAQFPDLWENYLTGETYYAFTAELDPPSSDGITSITVYTTTPEPTNNDILYELIDGEIVEIAGGCHIEGNTIELSYIANGDMVFAYATRDTLKDIKNYLLNTCTYAEYEDDLTTYGQCAKFAVDIDNETFRVPLIKDGAVIQQAKSDSELGKAYNAGLPNVEAILTLHHFTGNSGPHLTATGAFKDSTSEHSVNAAGSGTSQDVYITNFDFKASNSNPIYGNSDTVQMNAVALRYFVVVATGSINESMMDWSEWASNLQSKVNYGDLEEVILTPAGFGTRISIASGYTAPSDGLVYFETYSSSSGNNSYGYIDGQVVFTNRQSGSNANHHVIGSIAPIYKGQTVTTSGGNFDVLAFTPFRYE